MAFKIDLSGNVYERLTVLSYAGKDKHGQSRWLCKCQCGNEIVALSGNLKRGFTKSCGCLNLQRKRERLTTHGHSKEHLYYIHKGMIRRCSDVNYSGYKNYGGRNISVCDEWINSYKNFKSWALENGYSKGLVIDRIDNNGNYQPNNCQWITSAENNQAGKRRMHTNNKTGYTGVYFSKSNQNYSCELKSLGKRYRKSGLSTAEEAYKQRVEFEVKHFGRRVTFCDGKTID